MISLYTKKISGVWFGVASNEKKVFATTFGFNKERVLRNLLRSIPCNMLFQHLEKASSFSEHVMALLRDVYDGKDVSFSFHLATDYLSSYARKVVKTVSLVPLGYVTSYGSVAEAAGGSPRAVGRVMALNPFPLIVPCHRVVCSVFKLGGYGLGLDMKLEILRREGRGYTSKREIPVNGNRLSLFPVEFVLNKLRKDKKEITKQKQGPLYFS